MIKDDFLISVIIPTRNRQKYTISAVKSIISISDKIQVIVHDNSDDMSLKQKLSDIIDDERVIYHYVQGKIAGVDNYNLAAHYASGEFFCAIGDDDAVLPEIIDCAYWMKKNEIDVVIPSKKLTYFWPDTGENLSTKHSFLGISDFTGECKCIKCEEELKILLRDGGQHYLSLNLPGSYHCLVRTSRMQEVKNKTGKYYGGLSPDMYSVICLSLLPEIRVVSVDYPISLPGVCPKSTSAESDAGKHIGKLEDAPHFVGLLEPYKWDELIPEIYSVQTIWCETMVHAIKKMHREDLIKDCFNRKALISYLYFENKNDQEYIRSVLSDEDFQLIDSIYNKQRSLTKAKIKYLFNLMIGRRYRNYNCENISQAVIYTKKYLGKNRLKKAKNRYTSTIIDWRKTK